MHWTISLGSAPLRVNHAAVAVDDRIYSFGGYTSNEPLPPTMDVHVFDTIALSWWPVHCRDEFNAPAGLYGHSVAAHGQKIYIWGGQSDLGATNQIFCFNSDEDKWSIPLTTGQAPASADGHTACIIGDYMYVFGGYQQDFQRFSEGIHRINLLTYHWELLTTEGKPPDARDFHTASVIGDRMYVFGGRSCKSDSELDEEYYPNQVVYLDTGTMRWVMPTCAGTPPCGRRSHTASVYNNEIYIIAGYEGRSEFHLSDVHKFSPAANMWTKLRVRGMGPCPRRRHCACVVRDQLYLFGGSSPNNAYMLPIFSLSFPFPDMTYQQHKLREHNDLHVLEFFTSLKRMAQLEIIKNSWCLNLQVLPKRLRKEIEAMTKKEQQESSTICVSSKLS